ASSPDVKRMSVPRPNGTCWPGAHSEYDGGWNGVYRSVRPLWPRTGAAMCVTRGSFRSRNAASTPRYWLAPVVAACMRLFGSDVALLNEMYLAKSAGTCDAYVIACAFSPRQRCARAAPTRAIATTESVAAPALAAVAIRIASSK